MTIEQQALELVKENNELKAQVNAFRDGVTHFNRSGGDLNKLLTAYIETQTQCLKQLNIDLLKSIVDEFINSSSSCEHILATRLHHLENKDERPINKQDSLYNKPKALD